MEQPDPKHYNDFLQNSIQVLDTLVLSIELPPAIVGAINRQTQQFYEIQEFKYRVEREAQESRRKQIEANGIAAFQRTVSEGISDSYLRWRGIEATLALAQSSNSKIVIIGSGKDGLPIILGNVDSAEPTQAPGQSPQTTKPRRPTRPRRAHSPDTATSRRPRRRRRAGVGSGAGRQSACRWHRRGTPAQPSALDLSRLKALLPWLAEELGATKSAQPAPPRPSRPNSSKD